MSTASTPPPNRTRPPPNIPLPGAGARPRSGSAPQHPVSPLTATPKQLGVSAGRVPPPPPVGGGGRYR
ncbi:hypothetical protein BG011_002582 [Mortierella polycephala]|uniref:Uncharacterized protein n=1 Tax=Mortierella polycephala TaxID=41804 RepID=A0A9P6Q684_9FUNG|nr:hypothetical protein BG011_002582 [Mortierella polycephala]